MVCINYSYLIKVFSDAPVIYHRRTVKLPIFVYENCSRFDDTFFNHDYKQHMPYFHLETQ